MTEERERKREGQRTASDLRRWFAWLEGKHSWSSRLDYWRTNRGHRPPWSLQQRTVSLLSACCCHSSGFRGRGQALYCTGTVSIPYLLGRLSYCRHSAVLYYTCSPLPSCVETSPLFCVITWSPLWHRHRGLRINFQLSSLHFLIPTPSTTTFTFLSSPVFSSLSSLP